MEFLKKFLKSGETIPVTSLSSDTAKEIQLILRHANLYTGEIDGVVGWKTREAIAQFKEQNFLEYPDQFGTSTAEALLDYHGELKHPVSEQNSEEDVKLLPDEVLGSKTGQSAILPSGKRVYENELIINGIPLSWGEMTKGMTRWPVSIQVEGRFEVIAKEFGEIREKAKVPLVITSGYRPPKVNAEVHGSKFSRHMKGDAIDFYPLSGLSLEELWNITKAVAKTGGLGYGIPKGFIHRDRRPNQSVVTWPY